MIVLRVHVDMSGLPPANSCQEDGVYGPIQALPPRSFHTSAYVYGHLGGQSFVLLEFTQS